MFESTDFLDPWGEVAVPLWQPTEVITAMFTMFFSKAKWTQKRAVFDNVLQSRHGVVENCGVFVPGGGSYLPLMGFSSFFLVVGSVHPYK